ncbi:MAG: DRTGG domain-containing protein [Dehalococcoidales bacterium]|nr:DRTGG domain-containing protein [Dehalococcoidales bacterium]
MITLLVTSSGTGSGKTTVCAGLGRYWLAGNKKVGFFKPAIADGSNQAAEIDSDAVFLKQVFALEEPMELIQPTFKNESALKSSIKEAYGRVSRGKDIVITEGVSGQSRIDSSLVEALDARVIVVEDYTQEPLTTIERYRAFGKRLLGIVLNKVPASRLEQVRAGIPSRLGQSGLNVLGLLPEDRVLFTLTIGELAEDIHGELLRGADKSGELLESFMVGAKTVDSGLQYFNLKDNKLVVVPGERPDMQLAALQTSTRCLVVTGTVPPMPIILQQAEEKDVPVILTRNNVTSVITDIEDTLGKTRFNQENKLPRLTALMEQHFDFATLDKKLSTAS